MGTSNSNESTPGTTTATVLLQQMHAGSEEAASDLFVLLRDELHGIASGKMRRSPANHTLQATALVHEAWVRLMGADSAYGNREHFLAVAAKAMRSVLVDHARRNKRLKRGGDRTRITLDAAIEIYEDRSVDLIELDDALETLAVERQRQAKIVELRFFAGLSIEDVAGIMQISSATVVRDWRMARLWLLDRLGDTELGMASTAE